MRYLKYTYVDAVTGISATDAPAANGPVSPSVAGLEFGFALESEYPVSTPTMFGTFPDGASIDVPGVLGELTEAEYQAALDAEMLAREAKAAANQAEALIWSRADKVSTNNAEYEAAISAMTSDYPASEISTWERQRAEAVAWGLDTNVATPWIDIAATARGLDRDEYLARTLAKVTAFASASAYLTGRRQGIDDQLRAATTAEQLAAVVIDYTLPGA